MLGACRPAPAAPAVDVVGARAGAARGAGARGVAAKLFNTLGDASISVRAIAQGASERNISVVVDGKVGAKALRAVHAAFYFSPNTLSIGLLGPGWWSRR